MAIALPLPDLEQPLAPVTQVGALCFESGVFDLSRGAVTVTFCVAAFTVKAAAAAVFGLDVVHQAVPCQILLD